MISPSPRGIAPEARRGGAGNDGDSLFARDFSGVPAHGGGLRSSPVQMLPARGDGMGSGADPATVRAAATLGTSGPGGPLPFADRIQRSFGPHDISGVRAHEGATAASGARAMGASAFATGERIAFGRKPDLRTAAHEAAHILQQRSGAHIPGGIGRAGDRFERHADAVADRVVAGRSSDDLLAPFATGPRRGFGPAAIQRQPDDGGTGGGGKTLSNPLFAGDAVLQDVLDGKSTISSGTSQHVYKVQLALMNLGYALPIYGADSDFGKETTIALTQFQNDNGLSPTGVLDADTMDALDRKAPQTALTKYPEYAQLLGDGLLDFTVGVGYDEGGGFDIEMEPPAGQNDTHGAIIPALKTRGFEEKTDKDAEKVYAKAGMTMPASTGGRYFIKAAALTYKGKDIDVIVRLVSYKDPDARNAFLEAMQKSDVSIYTGHGRYGSGPDFDEKSKGDGNIFINPEQTVRDSGTAHMYDELKKQKVKEALPGTAFDQKYKIWFFDGCNTKHYMRPIRTRAKVDTRKTDVFGWGQEIGIDTTGEDVVSFIDGLIAMQSAQQLIDNLNKINGIDRSKPERGAGGEGLGDNPDAP
jgi:peptidoglycan hydrolase-like protein with peptidoglycan-binding domain